MTTVYVTCKRDKLDNTWIKGAGAIYRYLKEHNLNDVSVEITGPRAQLRKYCSPVYPTDTIFPVWQTVYESILVSIDTSEFTALECFRYGRGKESMENPPTVIISVRRGSGLRIDFRPVRERVISILDDLYLFDVAVCILENEVTKLHASNGLLGGVDECQQIARAGCSLGMKEKSSGTTGTLGGFVEIQCPTTGDWRKRGLTSFHCVYEGREGSTDKEKERRRMRAYI